MALMSQPWVAWSYVRNRAFEVLFLQPLSKGLSPIASFPVTHYTGVFKVLKGKVLAQTGIVDSVDDSKHVAPLAQTGFAWTTA